MKKIFIILTLIIFIFGVFLITKYTFFNTNSDYEVLSSDNEITITRYTGNKKSISIPTNINGKPVKKIGKYAFPSGVDYQSVAIPDSVTDIEEYAFFCSRLQNVIISDSVITIGKYAFSGNDFKEIKIGKSVTSIGDDAFLLCENLEKIEIPKSVTEIGEDAFKGCTKLVIYGQSGSLAQKYAEENSITFEVSE